jgi:hypothetical protein
METRNWYIGAPSGMNGLDDVKVLNDDDGVD